jgi:hypothetical protein
LNPLVAVTFSSNALALPSGCPAPDSCPLVDVLSKTLITNNTRAAEGHSLIVTFCFFGKEYGWVNTMAVSQFH